jgi:hypothetical protein
MEFTRYFTPKEATSALPLVRQIVEDILETARGMHDLDESEEELRADLQSELEQHLAELEDIGCYYKDWNFSVGLVDFPAIVEGEIVFLCWRSDEPELAWYHPIEEGYRGRRPLSVVPRAT